MGSRPAKTGRVDASAKGSAAAVKKQTNGTVRRHAVVKVAVVPDPAVKLVGVAKSYGKTPVLKGVNVTVATGEMLEITGPSGSGKTTLLRLLHGQLRPTAGEVWVRGRSLHRRWRHGLGGLRRDVAFVFQEQRLLPRLNAYENIVFALQLRDPQLPNRTIRDRAQAALESVNLGHRGRAYPHELSAGERQRVAVARALATRPRVLLADEPLASLDEDNAALVTRLLEDAAAAGTTVIVASHHHSFPAGRVLRLPSERLVANGAVKSKRNGNGHAVVMNGNGHGNGHANGHANGDGTGNGMHSGNGAVRTAAPAWWRVVVPRRERPQRAVRPVRLPVWRRAMAATANAHRLVVLAGLRSWARDLRMTGPVVGTVALLLTLCGVIGMVGVAVDRTLAFEAGQVSIVRVYLAQDATQDQVTALESKLKADPRVTSVKYVSAAQALAEAGSRPGLDNLASLSTTNPFPASLDVSVHDVTQVAGLAGSVKGDPAVDSGYPTSYDPATYSRLRHFALIAGGIAAGIVLLFAAVAYAVIANAMRGVAASRRNEVAVTRLLGARGWMMRGPFIVEGLTSGAIAGAVAAAFVGGVYLLATQFESAVYIQVLPGVDATAMRYVLAAIITAGLVLGTATALLGFKKARV